ncbi:MAG: hypothetical protein ACREI3_12715, partial [Nitrospirales bacterium]
MGPGGDRGVRTGLRRDRMGLMAIVLFASIFPVELFHGASPELRGADGQFSAKQGDAFLVRVPVDGAPESVTGHLLKRRIPF